MKKVIIYRRSILPSSETFIKQQILSLSVWQALLVGKERHEGGLDTSGMNTVVENESVRTPLGKVKRLLFGHFGWPMPCFYKRLLDWKPLLIHIHFGVDAVSAWSWLRYFKLPIVITLHGYDVSIKPDHWESGDDKSMRQYPRRLKILSAKNNVSFIAVSNAIREKAVSLYGLPAEKIKVLYIGVDEQKFAPVDARSKLGSNVVLFVGRLVEKKGTAVLIEAMCKVQAQMPTARLIIVGEGPMREQLQALATQQKISANFLGALPNNQVLELMRDARVFCLPSITAFNGDTEGLPIVLLEAQACGTPVITSAVGGRDEGIAEGITGLSFEEGDVSGLASQLIRLLNDDEVVCRMSAAGPKFISEKFSLRKCTERLQSHYDALVAAH